MNIKTIMPSFALVVALGTQSFAETPVVTIEELVTEVLKENPESEFYRAEVNVSEGDQITAGTWQNPNVQLQYGRKRNLENGVGGEGRAWSVSVMQSIEYPGRIALRKAIAGGQNKLAKLGFGQFRTALAAKARALAYELFIRRELANAAKQVAERGSELAAVLVQRDPAGITPLLERRIIEASVIKLRKQAIESEEASQKALHALNRLRGKDLSTALEVGASDFKLPVSPSMEELLEGARTQNFELRMQRAELETQGFKVALSKNERWPAVSVGPYFSDGRGGEEEREYGIGLSVPIPIWNQNEGNIVANTSRENQGRTTLRLAQQKVETEIREKSLSYSLLIKEIARWSPRQADDLRQAAELGDRHYRLGAIPVSTYVELQEQYLEALKTTLETKLEALKSIQSLELQTGSKYVGLETRAKKKPAVEEKK